MPKYLSDTPFNEILPQNLAADKTFADSGSAIDGIISETSHNITDLLIFGRLALTKGDGLLAPFMRLCGGELEKLPENLLDLLAWQLHVDGYETASSYAEKRALVDKSLLLHRRKGTPWAVKYALECLGYSTELIEGLPPIKGNGEVGYNGAAGYFSGNRWAMFDAVISAADSEAISNEDSKRLRKVIYAWKNTRSWLRALVWNNIFFDAIEWSDEFSCLSINGNVRDEHKWGFPLYDGQITYGAAKKHLYDSHCLYNGAETYAGLCSINTHFYNCRLEWLDFGVQTSMADTVRYVPRYDGLIHIFNGYPDFSGAILFDYVKPAPCYYNGEIKYEPSDCAIDNLQTKVKSISLEKVELLDKIDEVEVSSHENDRFRIAYNGDITYGQREIIKYEGATNYNGLETYGAGKSALFNGAEQFDGRICFGQEEPWKAVYQGGLTYGGKNAYNGLINSKIKYNYSSFCDFALELGLNAHEKEDVNIQDEYLARIQTDFIENSAGLEYGSEKPLYHNGFIKFNSAHDFDYTPINSGKYNGDSQYSGSCFWHEDELKSRATLNFADGFSVSDYSGFQNYDGSCQYTGSSKYFMDGKIKFDNSYPFDFYISADNQGGPRDRCALSAKTICEDTFMLDFSNGDALELTVRKATI